MSGINETIWSMPAVQGDVATVALDAGIGLRRAAAVLARIAEKLEIDISRELDDLEVTAKDLDLSFDRLSGYNK